MRRAKNEDHEATDRLGRLGKEGTGRGDELARALAPRPRGPKPRAPVAGVASAVEGAKQLWASPTRRHFLGLVLAAGAISVSGEALRSPVEPRNTWSGRTRWIGHC